MWTCMEGNKRQGWGCGVGAVWVWLGEGECAEGESKTREKWGMLVCWEEACCVRENKQMFVGIKMWRVCVWGWRGWRWAGKDRHYIPITYWTLSSIMCSIISSSPPAPDCSRTITFGLSSEWPNKALHTSHAHTQHMHTHTQLKAC